MNLHQKIMIFLPCNSLLYYAKRLLDCSIVKDKMKELPLGNTSNTFSLVVQLAKSFVILINYDCIDPFIVLPVLLLLNNVYWQKNKCLKGRFWERSKLVLEYSRISPDFAALIFFSEKFIFLVRQQVRHPLIHSGSPCHVSQPTLLPSLCRWAAQHSASPSPYCTVCTPLCQPFSSLPAVTHTSHNSDARLSCYTTRISGFYS